MGDTVNPHTGTLQKITDIQEEDGSPVIYAPEAIKVTNGALTDNGDGTVSLAVGGGGGGRDFTFVLAIGTGASTGINKTNELIATTAVTITKIWAYAKTAPTGDSLIFDINKNGTTIWTTQANRLTIAAAANSANTTTFDVTSLAAGDRLTIDIDQIGSTVAGQDITITVHCE